MQDTPRTLPTLYADALVVQVPAALTVHIVCTDWYRDLVNEIVRGARDCLADMEHTLGRRSSHHFAYGLQQGGVGEAALVQTQHRVSGSWEMMARVSALVHSRKLDLEKVCYVACGTVIRGETSHYDHLCQSVMQGLTNLVTQQNAIIGVALLTCDTRQQAAARAYQKGRDAMESAFVEMWRRVGGSVHYEMVIDQSISPGQSLA